MPTSSNRLSDHFDKGLVFVLIAALVVLMWFSATDKNQLVQWFEIQTSGALGVLFGIVTGQKMASKTSVTTPNPSTKIETEN